MSWLSTPWDQLIHSPVKEVQGGHTNDEMWHGTEYQGDFYEHNYNDSDSDSDMHRLSSNSDTKISDVPASLMGDSEVQDKRKNVWRCGIDDESNVQRFPAILRTNRQIHSEASSLLYGELSMNVQPGDVLCMNTGKDIVKASEGLWRHNPLHGIGSKNSCGQTVYAKPELDGVMEPHVLARFKKILFEFDVTWELEALENLRDPTVPSLYVNDDMTVNPEDEAKLLAFYRRSTIIHQLVKILSNSPDIVRFEIDFSIEVLAQYGDLDSDSEDDNEAEESWKPEAANERAMELFLESGLLAPLEKLSNVRSFTFEFTALDRYCETYKPSPRYDRILKDLKQKIEGNYALKKG